MDEMEFTKDLTRLPIDAQYLKNAGGSNQNKYY